MDKIYKITTIGDVMCEPALLAQVERNGSYDFTPVYAPLKSYFDEADYVIANLEMPLAGKDAGYTDSLASFNTPDTIAEALKVLGVDAVITANNHCCDRGYDGLVRTLRVLDKLGLAHTGTYAEPNAKERILYFTLGETKLALIAYTYSCNKPKNPAFILPENLEHCVNRLKPAVGKKASNVPSSPALEAIKAFIKDKTGHTVTWDENIELKRILGVPIAYPDNSEDFESCEKYLSYLKEDIAEAKKHADIVLVAPHVGGQFNTEPGTFSAGIIRRCVEFGADCVLAAHSHTTQKASYLNGIPCFYSLGNVSMLPHSIYAVRETLPEYGLAAHTYVQNGKIVKTGYSIFKICQEGDEPMTVIPCDELYRSLKDDAAKKALADDVAVIYTRVSEKPFDGSILREYPL